MLTEIIDTYIAEKNASIQRENGKFRVSDAGRCRLMRLWKRQGKPFSDTPDERTYRVFEVGHVFHVWLQELLANKKVLLASEFEVEDIHRIGHVDAIVNKGSGLILYDFKTVHSKKFSYIKKDADLHYHFQASTYAMMLPFGVEQVLIAYVSKDDLRIQEVSVEVDVIGSQVEEDWKLLIEAWENQVEPTPNPMSWECKYCNYQSSCTYRN